MRKLLIAAVAALALPVTIWCQPATAQEDQSVEAASWVDVPHEFRLAIDDLVEWLTVLGGAPAMEQALRDAAAEFGVDGNLLVCLARHESGLNHAARNRSSGAAGLLQHLPRYYSGRALASGADPSRIDPYRPRQNARAGAWLLATGGRRHWVIAGRC